MKSLILAAVAAFCVGTASAQTTAKAKPLTEAQALEQHINKLMRDPAKPKQEIRLDLQGCHATQTIRDNDSDTQTSAPISVSYNKGGEAGWAAKVANGKFELILDFEWREVESLTYERNKDKDDAPYEVKIKRVRKSGSTSFELPLFTTDERVVRDVVARLERVRQSCR
ncbi:hypothetical protein F0P96_09960 [Hymenobacter busanensis]|uniref:Uncharacterized protein n=1 Tax=Hymenobacter busanensis TaxID=2607656 RepID=A0A7L4ZYM4_9BACT|nr:hypothetical protein [Hymenobacter busanensis]KAA9333290.1 hypothetical protein F0P96_09960 [Hymenobacter busanensis]QHJ08033.1 hypothetical protein GUY19_12360 [Hymenobacter busanensis]